MRSRQRSYSDAVPKKKKAKQKQKQKETLDPRRKLVLYIPQALSEGTQRENLRHSTPFASVLERIYETLGCVDLEIKPKLSYKLSNATAKSDTINLTSAADWEGCLEEVTEVERKKKGLLVSVRIQVSEQYLLSLRALLGKGKGSGSSKAGKKGGKKAMPLLDLEHAQDGEDDFDSGLGIMEKESEKLEQLQKHYGRCQMCGPTKACKITIAGEHHPLSNNQLRAWAHCLAAETHGVTLQTPPHAKLFQMFFKSSGPAAPAPPSNQVMQSAPGYNGGPWNPPNHPYGYPYMGGPMPPLFTLPMQPQFGGNGQNIASTSSTRPALASSDPPDMDAANPYPGIGDFITRLAIHHPQRNLTRYITAFDDLDFYHIDEVQKLKTPEELTRLIGISAGNASLLLDQVKAEMKRVDRNIRAAKASVCYRTCYRFAFLTS
ncbi:hypothetical protein C8R46DRAFT_1314133 [Mycena filopes]|nr:hypothetical protein C8R46DRAFT_1314133 [Mycena filopes]